MPGRYYFVIVGRKDNPLYERNFESKQSKENDTSGGDGQRHLNQFIAHGALDLVDTYKTQNSAGHMYLKVIDKFNEWFVSAHVSASSMRFIMLHNVTNEEGINMFFRNANELYIKHIMNPLCNLNDVITSKIFDQKILLHSDKYLIN